MYLRGFERGSNSRAGRKYSRAAAEAGARTAAHPAERTCKPIVAAKGGVAAWRAARVRRSDGWGGRQKGGWGRADEQRLKGVMLSLNALTCANSKSGPSLRCRCSCLAAWDAAASSAAWVHADARGRAPIRQA
jgi:hypothetical protein